MVERIRSLLTRFSEDEATVRRMSATDTRFNLLCHEYHTVVELLNRKEAEVEELIEIRARLEEELLTRIEGYQPR